MAFPYVICQVAPKLVGMNCMTFQNILEFTAKLKTTKEEREQQYQGNLN